MVRCANSKTTITTTKITTTVTVTFSFITSKTVKCGKIEIYMKTIVDKEFKRRAAAKMESRKQSLYSYVFLYINEWSFSDFYLF